MTKEIENPPITIRITNVKDMCNSPDPSSELQDGEISPSSLSSPAVVVNGHDGDVAMSDVPSRDSISGTRFSTVLSLSRGSTPKSKCPRSHIEYLEDIRSSEVRNPVVEFLDKDAETDDIRTIPNDRRRSTAMSSSSIRAARATSNFGLHDTAADFEKIEINDSDDDYEVMSEWEFLGEEETEAVNEDQRGQRVYGPETNQRYRQRLCEEKRVRLRKRIGSPSVQTSQDLKKMDRNSNNRVEHHLQARRLKQAGNPGPSRT